MKVPRTVLRRAAARKRSQQEQQAPSPKRPARRAPSPPARQDPPDVPEIDLTGDSPGEEAAAEAPAQEAAGAPTIEEMAGAPTWEGAPTREETAGPEELSVLPEPVPAGPDRDWGEGPSGAADMPAGPTPIGSHPRAEPGDAEGSGIRAVPARDSVVNNLRWAAQLISPAIVPEIQEEMSHMRTGAFFRESYAALARVINTLAISKEVIRMGKTATKEAQKETEEARARADEARARAEAAEGSLESVRAECSRKIKEAEDEVGAANQRASAAESKAEAADRRAAAAVNQFTDAESALEARNLRIADLESVLQAVRDQLKGAEEEGGRAKEAERVAVAALAAEREAAGTRAAQAIEKFKASREYMDDLGEASADAYLEGFRRGKEKVAHELNFPQALEVEPDRLSEVASDEDEDRADG